MLRLLSKIHKLPVIPQTVGSPAGTVADYVLDPSTGKIVAYELSGRGEARFFSCVDVLKYYDDGILISDPDVLQPVSELLRVQSLLKPRVRLHKLKVVTEEGEKLGKAADCLVDTTGHFVAKLYVTPSMPKRIFTENMIIPRQHILEITPKQILVRHHHTPAASKVKIEPKVAG